MSRLFLSYKSEDSNLVRGVAERLVAAGLDVWFAETDIGLDDFPETDAEVERRLSGAVGLVDGAVVFTNDRWSQADWCRFEIRTLLERIAQPSRLLEIYIPREHGPHREFPALAGVRGVEFSGDASTPTASQLARAADQVLAHFGLPPTPPLVWTMGTPLRLPRYGLSVDLGPFRPNLYYTRRLQPLLDSRTLICRAEIGGRPLTLDLYAQPYGTPSRELSIAQSGAVNDREIYTRYRRFAKRWLDEMSETRGIRWESRGVHLVFSGGRSHLGLTYVPVNANADGDYKWERRYAIASQGIDPAEQGEVGLVFGVHLSGSDDEQRRAFARLAPAFDAVAVTARYVPTEGVAALMLHLPIALSRVVYIGAAIGGIAALPSNPPALAAVGLVYGFALGDVLHLSISRLYRRLLWTWQPIVDDAAPRAAYERLSTELVFWLLSFPVLLIAVATSLRSVAGGLWALAAAAVVAATVPIPNLPMTPVAPALAPWLGAAAGLALALIGGRAYTALKRARVQ